MRSYKDNERQRLMELHQHRYERWTYEGDNGNCFYCDEPPHGIDHVPALSWVDLMVHSTAEHKYGFFLVRACIDCNSRLHNKPLHTLAERTAYIAKKLSDKYEHSAALWPEEDLAEMSRTMQVYIRAKQERLSVLLDRIRAAQRRLAKEEGFPPEGTNAAQEAAASAFFEDVDGNRWETT